MLRGAAVIGVLMVMLLAALMVISFLAVGPVAGSPQLLYVSIPDVNGDAKLYIHDVRHGARIALLTTLGWGSQAAWSPDGERIVFSAFGESAVYHDIFVLDVATGHIQQITDSSADFNSPAWSPDGERLIFEGNIIGRSTILFTHDLEQRQTQTLFLEGERPQHPRWSPDGEQLLYISFASSTAHITLFDLTTSEATTLTEVDVYDLVPRWSPDGEQIAYTFCHFRCYLYTKIIGSESSQLRYEQEYQITNPAWSPDGRRIAFEGTGIKGDFNRHIYTVPAAGEARLQRISYGNEGYTSADWRP